MGVAERKAREKTELRQEILDAAREIFVAEGYEALTMRRVAQKIEYSPTTIYLYFKDKSDLVQAICDESFGKLIHRLEDLAGKHADPLEYLEAGLRAYIDFGLKHPSHYYATFIGSAGKLETEYEGSTGQRAFEFLRQAVARSVEAGRIRDVDVDATAQSLWAATHGLVALLISNKPFPFVGRQRLIDALMSMLMKGLER